MQLPVTEQLSVLLKTSHDGALHGPVAMHQCHRLQRSSCVFMWNTMEQAEFFWAVLRIFPMLSPLTLLKEER